MKTHIRLETLVVCTFILGFLLSLGMVKADCSKVSGIPSLDVSEELPSNVYEVGIKITMTDDQENMIVEKSSLSDATDLKVYQIGSGLLGTYEFEDNDNATITDSLIGGHSYYLVSYMESSGLTRVHASFSGYPITESGILSINDGEHTYNNGGEFISHGDLFFEIKNIYYGDSCLEVPIIKQNTTCYLWLNGQDENLTLYSNNDTFRFSSIALVNGTNLTEEQVWVNVSNSSDVILNSYYNADWFETDNLLNDTIGLDVVPFGLYQFNMTYEGNETLNPCTSSLWLDYVEYVAPAIPDNVTYQVCLDPSTLYIHKANYLNGDLNINETVLNCPDGCLDDDCLLPSWIYWIVVIVVILISVGILSRFIK